MIRAIVDTSVWSLALRRRPRNLSPQQRRLVLLLHDMIVDGDPILLGVVRQELLTGIRNTEAFESACTHLQNFDDLPPAVDDYERAANFATQCLALGIATTTVDMLIIAVAAGRDLPILTADGDFGRFAQHLPIRLHPVP